MNTKKQNHFNNCSAPICACDTNPSYKEDVIWCPGEQVCKWKPYQKFQEQQIIINKWFRKGKVEDGTYSAQHLEKLTITKNGKIKS